MIKWQRTTDLGDRSRPSEQDVLRRIPKPAPSGVEPNKNVEPAIKPKAKKAAK